MNEKTGGVCSLSIELDSSYAYYRNIEYRITTYPQNSYFDCIDYEGNKYESFASAAQTNYSEQQEDKSLFILGLGYNTIDKVYFLDNDFNSTNDITCLNLVKVD